MQTPKFSKLDIAKSVASNVVQWSTSFTVGAIVHATCPTASKAQKAKMVIGSYALGAVAAEKTGDFIVREIDDLVALVKKAKDKSATAEVDATEE
jgi:NAD/NADP transhydrogenase alpha subunit